MRYHLHSVVYSFCFVMLRPITLDSEPTHTHTLMGYTHLITLRASPEELNLSLVTFEPSNAPLASERPGAPVTH